jgi:hypothetical protein
VDRPHPVIGANPLNPIPPRPEEELAVLRTVVYASLFDYPLTAAELCESLIGTVATEDIVREWCAASPLLRATIDEADGYYFPRGRRELLSTRRRRETASRRLLSVHGPTLRFVSNLPFVRMVALSGSLAHLNAARGADVDLFVITTPNRVWSVTVTALIAARLRGWRQDLCLNYVISERELEVGPQDLFTANQIIHLRPLVGVEVYRRFIDANAFVGTLYPNFHPRGEWPLVPRGSRHRWKPLAEWMLNCLFVADAYERLCRIAYAWYLRRQAPRWQSRDQVRLEPGCLKLHTTSHRAEVMARFKAAFASLLASAEELQAVRR